MIEKEKYLKTVRRPYPPFYTHLIMSGYREEKNYLPFIGEIFHYKNMIKSQDIWCYNKNELKLASELTLRKWANPKFFKKAILSFEKQEKKLIRASRKSLNILGYRLLRQWLADVCRWFIAVVDIRRF